MTTLVERKRERRIWPWLVFLPPALLVTYLSWRPVMRLRPDPPPEFVDVRADARRRAAEEQLARAYWKIAVQVVQWKFAFGENLPDHPIPEFGLDPRDLPKGAAEAAAASRFRYWQRLARVWPLPQSWERTHEWSLNWVGNALFGLQEWTRNIVQGILQKLRT